MPKLSVAPDSIDVSLLLFIQDSSSGTGAGLTGLAYNSAGLTCYYVQPGGNATAITLATQTVTGAHSNGGFVEISSTNMPGWYRFDPPDEPFAAGVRSVGLQLKGAANMVPINVEVDLANEVNVMQWSGQDVPSPSVTGTPDVRIVAGAANVLTASLLATDAVQEIRDAITGGAYALSTDANGRIRIVDGTGAGELDTSSGTVTLTDGSLTAAKIASAAFTAAKFDSTYSDLLEAEIDGELELYGLDHLVTAALVGGEVADDTIIARLASASGTWSTFAESTDSLEALRNWIGNGSNFTGLPDVTLADGAQGGSSTVLTLQKLIIASSGSDDAVSITGSGDGRGLFIKGGATAAGVKLEGGSTSGEGLHVTTSGDDFAVALQGGGNRAGLLVSAVSTDAVLFNGGGSGAGLLLVGGATGHAFELIGGSTSGDGINISVTSGDLIDADAVNQIRNAITGGAYALDTDSNGRMRVVDGTGAGEIATTGGAIDSVLALGTQAKADVNEQVVDALNVDTYAEPSQGTPPATAALAVKLNWLYTAWRNKKEQTSSLHSLYGDDGTTVLAKSSVSDDGTTFTAGEFVTGA